MPAHHTLRDAPAFGRRATLNTQTNAIDADLHAQLSGIEAAVSHARRGWTLRLALGFAAFGILAALWAGPNVEDAAYSAVLAFQGSADDDLTTASVRRAAPTEGGTRVYELRQSVLQAPGEVCTVENDVETCDGGLR